MLSINIEQLERLLAPHMESGVWPHLGDDATQVKARDLAQRTGLWEELGAEIEASAHDQNPFAVIRRSQWRDYSRTGERASGEMIFKSFQRRTERMALAVWLDHPAVEWEQWQDLLWAWCETTWWKLPAHEPQHTDLTSSLMTRQLAEWKWMSGDRLESEVSQRISQEVARRSLDIALDPAYYDVWQTCHNNWNLVCNANLIGAALYEIANPFHLAALVHCLTQRLDYAIEGFTDDGGCVEGAGYWEYGFSHFLDVAIMLHYRTGGAVDLTRDPKIERIARFPFAAMLKAPLRASFADGGHGYFSSEVALKIARLWDLPQIFQLVAPTAHGELELLTPRAFALWGGEKPLEHTERDNAFLPSLGFAKQSAGDAVLAVTAGRNDVPHNHNDVGGFIYLWGDTVVLDDPGTPVYNAQTFSSRRYEMLVCRSKGHSVPFINGLEQQSGEPFYGTLNQGQETDGTQTLVADLTRAYPDPTLRQLTRHFKLQSDSGLEMRDEFDFSASPHALEEAFITRQEVNIVSPNVAHIGVGDTRFALSCQAEGNFSIQSFTAAEHQGRDERTLCRLAWTPTHLTSRFTLVFQLKHLVEMAS